MGASSQPICKQIAPLGPEHPAPGLGSSPQPAHGSCDARSGAAPNRVHPRVLETLHGASGHRASVPSWCSNHARGGCRDPRRCYAAAPGLLWPGLQNPAGALHRLLLQIPSPEQTGRPPGSALCPAPLTCEQHLAAPQPRPRSRARLQSPSAPRVSAGEGAAPRGQEGMDQSFRNAPRDARGGGEPPGLGGSAWGWGAPAVPRALSKPGWVHGPIMGAQPQRGGSQHPDIAKRPPCAPRHPCSLLPPPGERFHSAGVLVSCFPSC